MTRDVVKVSLMRSRHTDERIKPAYDLQFDDLAVEFDRANLEVDANRRNVGIRKRVVGESEGECALTEVNSKQTIIKIRGMRNVSFLIRKCM